MSSQEVYVVALVTPSSGKEARLRELLVKLANDIKEHELGTKKYQVFEQFDGEKGNMFVVQEIYEDHAAYEAHFKTSYFQELGGILAKENLLAAPLDIKKTRPFGGFESRN